MAATPSVVVQLGTPAPNFKLNDVVSGGHVSLTTHNGSVATVIMFVAIIVRL